MPATAGPSPLRESVDGHLRLLFQPEACPRRHPTEVRLWEAMAYAALAPGKRLRPLLLLEAGRAFGATMETLLPAAAALELVHTYSLIHDDLPCMDDDDLRRGRPTLHKAYDEATAVLVGDALLGFAFGHIIRQTPNTVAPQRVLTVVAELSEAASLDGLINGQFTDLCLTGQPAQAATEDDLTYIHRHKTGALFRVALRAGGWLGGAPEETVDLLGAVGDRLGLAFQLADDWLDATATPEALGKTPGKDARQGKVTAPQVYGLAETRERARDATQAAMARWIQLCRQVGLHPGGIGALIQDVWQRLDSDHAD